MSFPLSQYPRQPETYFLEWSGLQGLQLAFHGFYLSADEKRLQIAMSCDDPLKRSPRIGVCFVVGEKHQALFSQKPAEWAARRKNTLLEMLARRLAKEVKAAMA